MDDDDKNFFSVILDDIKKKIEKIEKHQAKTCDELDTVHNDVVKIGMTLENHLQNESDKEASSVQSKRSSREKKSMIISVVSVCSAIVIAILSTFTG